MTRPDFASRLKPAEPTGAATLLHERQRSNLDVEALSEFLLGRQYLDDVARLTEILQRDKIFSKQNQANLSRPERYMVGLARAKKLRRLADEHKWCDDTYEIAKYLVDDVSPYTLHTTMFRQTLREQASDEQQAYWLPRHERWEIIGAYAQTEMGHGSNVRGIETEARWDPTTKEFVLHSPHLTSSKWWNGSLGRTANHAIVMAQLILPEKATGQNPSENSVKLGVHPFIVQVRDMVTHQPLEGIIIGDIGPKYGYAPMDNAYMLFHNHRIPHAAMLSRYAQLDPDTGVFTKPKNQAVVYGSLTEARSRIVLHARLVLARAVTVAVRYTCVRRQFRSEDTQSTNSILAETSVLDYSSVQIRILPLLATTFAFHFGGAKMKELFNSTRASVASGDFSSLAQLHNISSSLKSFCTDIAANGIETCRRALGGHGYGGYSGLKQLNDDYLSKPTVEGDNWMITQQVAKQLIKKVRNLYVNPPSEGNVKFGDLETSLLQILQQTHHTPALTFRESDDEDTLIIEAFQFCTAFQAFQLYREKEVERRPWDDLLLKAYKLSRMQASWILASSFYQGLQSPSTQDLLGKNTIFILKKLFRLFVMSRIAEQGIDFFQCGILTADQLHGVIDNKILGLMRDIRPHAVNLVDAWALPDYLLDSSLGRFDGHVYEDMFQRAHEFNPLNRITFNPNYKEEEIVMGAKDGQEILAKL